MMQKMTQKRCKKEHFVTIIFRIVFGVLIFKVKDIAKFYKIKV